MNLKFGEVIRCCGIAYIYCAPCPVRPDLLSIVLPLSDISNPEKVLNSTISTDAKKRVAI
jgi:hypothetical protein